ncbi:hypothetical protein [Streptomyces sp. NPDC005498]
MVLTLAVVVMWLGTAMPWPVALVVERADGPSRFQERKTSGAVLIQDNGCGFSTLLVVTGPHRGSLWFDGRATCDQILPLNLGGQPVSFMDWITRRSMDLVGW